ncbi:MAG: tyrosine-protein phosphatase [Dehalococcoidia bacterium]|nr:tyrosine-protein phosphatase [Dehalococcoidia bacterium]
MQPSPTREPEGVHNFRPLAPYPLAGGGHIRPGMVYRSGALELMTEADRVWLTEEVRIARVLDLRHPDELGAAAPAHAIADRALHLSIFPETGTQADMIAELNGLYGTGPTPERYLHYLRVGGRRFARAVTMLAEADSYPVLIHCTAGKDRTGVLIALLMDVLGASEHDIATEYGLSNAAVERLIAYAGATNRHMEGTPEEIRARLATPPERMAGFIDLLRAHYGSAEGYLLGEGVQRESLGRLRDLVVAMD